MNRKPFVIASEARQSRLNSQNRDSNLIWIASLIARNDGCKVRRLAGQCALAITLLFSSSAHANTVLRNFIDFPYMAHCATTFATDGIISSLHGYDNQAHLIYVEGAIGSNGASVTLPTTTPGEEQPGPDLTSDSFGGPQVTVFAARTAGLTHSNSNGLTFTIRNPGTADSVYVLSATSSLLWIDVTTLPATVSVVAGQTVQVTIPVSVPASVVAGTTGTLRLVADTQPSIPGYGAATIDLTVVDSVSDSSIVPKRNKR